MKLFPILIALLCATAVQGASASLFAPIFSEPTIPSDPYPKCDAIPSYNQPLDEGERMLYKAFFPNLNVQTAKETSIATRCYNCIAWTLGVTNDWLWPDVHAAASETSTTVQDFDDFYGKLGFVRTQNPQEAYIALWGNTSPSGTIYATHASINKAGTPQWESKLGAFIRMQHDKDDLVGTEYGKIVAYYKKDINLAQSVAEQRRTLIAQRPRLSLDEYRKIQNQVKRLPLQTKRQFSDKYDAWKSTWFTGNQAISSNPKSRKNSPEYQALLAMGEQVLPLVVSRMILSDNVFALQLYDDLQKNKSLKITYNAHFSPLEGEAGRAAYTVKKYASTL